MSDLAWRPAGHSDATGVAELFRLIELAAPLGLETELAEVEARMSRPGLDLRADTLVGTDPAGTLLAYAETADMGVGNGQARVRVTCAVLPGLDAEITRAALDWALGRARLLVQDHHPGLPFVLGARCAAADHARSGWLAQAGFRIVFWLRDLERPVAPPPPVSPLPGIMVIGYDPRHDEAARLAHNDAYAADPGALLPDAEGWPLHATGLATFLPGASFLALTGDQEIAGFLFSLEHRDTAGLRQGTLHCLGTREPWRRRGIAAALIAHALTAYQQAGFTTATLQVEDTNTAAIGLYGRLGFADSGRGYAILQAPVPA
jgi:mycothiol synthase